MQEISAHLSSSAWWFSAVVVALLINMVSSYMKPWTDAKFSAISSRWRQRSARRQEQFEKEVEASLKSPHVLRNNVERESRQRQQAVYMVLLGMFLLFLGPLSGTQVRSDTTVSSASFLDWYYSAMKVVGFLFVVFSIALSKAADRLEEIVITANLRLSSNEQLNAPPGAAKPKSIGSPG